MLLPEKTGTSTRLLSFYSIIYLIIQTHIKSFSLKKRIGSIAKKKQVKWTEDGLPLTRLSILVKNQNSDHKIIFFVVCWLLTLKMFSESLKSSVSSQCAFSYWFSIFTTTLLVILQYPLLREALSAFYIPGKHCLALHLHSSPVLTCTCPAYLSAHSINVLNLVAYCTYETDLCIQTASYEHFFSLTKGF